MTFRVSGNIENALSLGGGEGVGFTGIERICDLRFLQNQISKKYIFLLSYKILSAMSFFNIYFFKNSDVADFWRLYTFPPSKSFFFLYTFCKSRVVKKVSKEYFSHKQNKM